jgi:hypothetical protein
MRTFALSAVVPIVVFAGIGALGARAELPPPPSDWVDWPMNWTADAPGAFDASGLLDKPAGGRGPVVVRGSHFVTAANNKRIRFWGVNFAFAACFPTHGQADAVAVRLARFGINAVRLHHMDMQPFPGGIWTDNTCETISPEALDRLDYLVAALKKQGIYCDVNLHVSRTWSKAHHWENADKLPQSFDKMIDLFHPELLAANKKYAAELLGHVNTYTKARYADEPAVCFVEINNEDTLFLWGGEQALAKLPEPYAGMLKKLWNEWLVKKYGLRETLKKAWAAGEAAPADGKVGRLGLREGEDPNSGTVASHAPGGAGETAARSADWFDFLQQTDEKCFVEMHDFLKKEVGVKCPVNGSFGLGPLGTLGQSKMDFVDAHAYWDHPTFPRRQWDMRDWLIKNQPMVDRPEGATLWSLAATRVAGKPFTVTEYNHAAPNEWQAECVPMLASYAALQDWDAVFLFAYSHGSDYDKGRMASFFDIEGNPLKMPFMPLAARIFTSGGLKPIEGDVAAVPADHREMLRTGSQFYYQTWPWVKSHNVKWQEALRQKLALDFNFDRHASPSSWSPDDARVEWSSTGSGTGQYWLKDDRAIVFVGFAPREPLDLGAVRIDKLDSPFASLLLTPAEPGRSIEAADRLLLAIAARAQNKGTQWNDKRTSVGDHWGTAPAQVEVVKGQISLRSHGKVREVYALTPEGKRGNRINVDQQGEWLSIPIGSEPAVWYEIVSAR